MKAKIILTAIFSVILSACTAPDPFADDEIKPGLLEENSVQVSKPSTTEILVRREFNAPPQTVFSAMTESEHLYHWLKPSNMTVVTLETDPQPTGSFRYEFRRPSGRSLEVRGEYEEFDPPNKFSYVETYDFSPLKVFVESVFESLAGRTAFSQRLKYASEDERNGDFEGVSSSALEAYSALDSYLKQVMNSRDVET